jgi:tetratricopeptide (TPR) repeat protein
VFLYASYYYIVYIVGAFHKYPESVAKPLRKALYYDKQAPDPKKALKYYQDALKEAAAIGMDPWSDEIVGLKIQVAAFLEKNGAVEMSARILDRLRQDSLTWVEEQGDKHFSDGRRTAILSKTVAIGIKLGELYSSPLLKQPEAAEASLVSAVEAVLREKERREKEGVKEGEGEWVNDEESGASFEALAQHYESANKHYLATPLFLQAMTLCPPKSCHRVVLMNNVAMSLAQQRPPPSIAGRGEQLPTPDVLRQQATLWAQKAVQLAADIKPPDRTEECDMGCAVATHNLGELAEMAGNVEEAKKRYMEAESLAGAIGFIEGVEQAKEGLKRLGPTKS